MPPCLVLLGGPSGSKRLSPMPPTTATRGPYANGPGLPPTVTITKLFASTRIRCKIYNVSAWATGAVGYVIWGVAVNGGAIGQITQLYFNRLSIRQGIPFGVVDFAPGSYPQINTTGPMQVVWYIYTSGGGCTWNVDTNDDSSGPLGLISEVP